MNRPRLLIVEDNTAVAEDCREGLATMGYDIAGVAAAGEDALEIVRDEMPDAVLMDIHLRGALDGIETARRIFEQHRVPVVFLSAYSDDSLLERARAVGSYGYLIKPFEERELHATLEMALYKARTERELSAMQARLSRSEKEAGLLRMASSIAHNYNNMLQSALGFSELALDEMPDGTPGRDTVLECRDSIERAAELSRRILMCVGLGLQQRLRCDLAGLVCEETEALRGELPGGVVLEIEEAEEAVWVETDPDQLRLLLRSLLVNAVEAMEGREGRITLRTRRERLGPDDEDTGEAEEQLEPGLYAMLEVEDEGCGMDAETRRLAFDPFFSTKFLGRGLGLSVVRGILRSHHGAIRVQSEADRGSRFSVYLPGAAPA